MAQIVINISDGTYNRCKNERVGLLPFDIPEVCDAIKNGTVLPKGHGRIADVDKMLDEMRATRTYDILFALERVKPIIEADKGEE